MYLSGKYGEQYNLKFSTKSFEISKNERGIKIQSS